MARVYLDTRTGYWCLDYKDVQGHRKQVKAGRTKTLAEAMLRKKLDEIVKQKIYGDTTIQDITFEDFATNQYLPYSKTNKRPSSARRDITSYRQLLKVFQGKKLSEISVKSIENYKANRLAANKARGTINRELACLRNMFTMAIKWKYANTNPVKEGIKLFKEDNCRVRYLSPQEKDSLLAYCPERIKPIVLTALFTGMRKGEIFRLLRSDIDLERGIITVRDTKNHETRYIPINKILKEVLENAIRIRNMDDPRVFWSSLTNFRKEWYGTLKRAGITNFKFHDLRHTFASYLVMAGVDLKTVQELLGHKTLTMSLRYAHLAPAHMQTAVEKLANVLGNEVDKRGIKEPDRVATYLQHEKLPFVEARQYNA